ncbi:MAG: zinc-binding dehydrogenase [Hyphomicrobiales bacterium]
MSQLPASMRAVVLRGRGFENLALETVPLPVPGPGQALVRVDAAGICASLVKMIAQGNDHTYLYGWDLAQYPAILGDEGSVALVAVGEGLSDQYVLGTRFVVQPAVDVAPINHAERYRNNGRGVSKIACGYTLPGHLAEYMLIPEEVFSAKCLVPVPNHKMPFAHAAISEPISCCVSGQFHHVHLHQTDLTSSRTAEPGLKNGGTCVIIGLGAMGRMHVDVALAQSASVVIGSDPMQVRRERTIETLSSKASANNCKLLAVDPADLQDTVDGITDGRGVDDLIIAVGHPTVIENSLPLLGKGGVANLFGGLKKGQEFVSLNANNIHYSETMITGSSGGTAWDIAQTLDWMAAGSIDASQHIAKIGSLEHAIEMIHDVKDQKLDGKAVLYPHHATDSAFDVSSWTAEDEHRHLAGGG